jgi:hypothetical protein
MAYFQTKNPNLGKFLECVAMKNVGKFNGRLVYFTAISNILRPFVIFCGHLLYFVAICYIICGHLLYFVVILVYFSHFGMLYQEKSGNPGNMVALGGKFKIIVQIC